MTMIVVNKDYAIGSDPLQWIIYRRLKPTEKNPDGGWQAKYYFTTIERAIKELYQIILRSSDCESFAELVALAKATEEMLLTTFSPDLNFELDDGKIIPITGVKNV